MFTIMSLRSEGFIFPSLLCFPEIDSLNSILFSSSLASFLKQWTLSSMNILLRYQITPENIRSLFLWNGRKLLELTLELFIAVKCLKFTMLLSKEKSEILSISSWSCCLSYEHRMKTTIYHWHTKMWRKRSFIVYP